MYVPRLYWGREMGQSPYLQGVHGLVVQTDLKNMIYTVK